MTSLASLDARNRLTFRTPKELPYVGYLDWVPPTLIAPLPNAGFRRSSDNASGAENWMLDDDFSCFILGVHDMALQKVQLVNAVQDGEKAARVARRLIALGIISQPSLAEFDLEHPANHLVLEPGVRIKLNVYGLWAATGSLQTLQAILAHVKGINERWQTFCNQKGYSPSTPYPRFNIDLQSIAEPVFEVVLQPEYMLRGRACFAGRPASPAHSLPAVCSGMIYIDDGRLKLRTDGGDIIDYPAFVHRSDRRASDEVNIFLLLLNAQARFAYHKQYFGLDKLSPHDHELIQLTDEIVEALCFVPVPQDGSPGADKDAKRTEKAAKRAQWAQLMTGPPKQAEPSPNHEDRGSVHGSQQDNDQEMDSDTSSIHGGSSGGRYNPQNMDSAGSMIGREPLGYDEDYGLTHAEMDVLEARMTDSNLTSKQRAEACMIFIFGNRKFAPLPEIPGLTPPPMIGSDV